MHPGIELTLAEYLAKRGSTLVGTLYPVLDPQARSFANNLAKALFRDHYSWGESVRRAREAAKFDDSLFYRAAYCYFGIPWQMSPLFSARKHLSILVPAYLRQVYELVKPSKVYSSLIDLEFVPPAQLKGAVDRLDEAAATDDGFLFIAALPSVHVAELLKNKDWVVLGPMVASQGDVRFIATDPIEDFRQATVWHHQDIVIKGRDLTASAFLEVLLHKWGIRISESQWKTIPTDCAPVIREGLAKFGLMVAREDLPINESGTSTTEPFIGHSLFEVDTELAKFYDGEPIPRILWVTKRACTTGWRRFYIVEFFKRLSERISDENRNSDLAVLGSTIPSKVRLYRVGDKDDYKIEINQAKRTLSKFLRDWAELDPDPQKPRQKIADGNWYDWSATEDKQQE
jgi:hypothetical protein